MRWRTLWRGCVAGAFVYAIGLGLGPRPAFSETTSASGLIAKAESGADLSPLETRQLAVLSVANRRPDLAVGLTDALLARNPEDVDALLIRSRALRDLGRTDEAASVARRAWRLAEKDSDRYVAAMSRAQALASSGRRTVAQYWLRRAADEAPAPAMRQRAVRDFRYVRGRNPWATELRFSVLPTDNINNGSSHDRISVDGLPFELTLLGAARALSGTELDYGVSTRYRFSQTGTRAHDVLLRASHRTYRLSEEARSIAPGVEGRDFAEASLILGYAQSLRLNDRGEELVLSGLIGQNWYGGDPYGRFTRLSADLTKRPSATSALRGGVTLEWRDGPREPDALRGQISASYDARLGDAWRFGVYSALTLSQSDNIRADYREVRAGASVAPVKPWGPVLPRLSLGWRDRDYDAYTFSSSGRQDTELSATLEFQFQDVEYLGFNPVLTVETSRTQSNLDLYDARRSGIGLTIRSAF